MIQRVQTIFLLLTSVFYFFYWLFGLEWYERGYPVIIDIFNESEYINRVLISISFIPLIITGISLFSIFVFKNRKLQMKLTQLGFRLSLVMSLFTIFYFYNCLSYLTELMPSKFLELLMYAAIVNPFLCCYLLFLALKYIKRDNELINSLERIR
tara:strand:+ start:36 stop:497 length:462 start_codon:yes stop_codon:yes gene_type:complete